jgi:hypothetical protein
MIDNPAVTYKLAATPESLEKVYRLRYQCYRRQNSIDPTPDEQFSDAFDTQPNSFNFLARNSAKEPFATVRISVVKPDLGWLDSPAKHVFGDHPAFHAIGRSTFVEASRLCFSQQARRGLFVQLLGNMAALAEFFGAEWLVACPRAEHSEIYQRLFGFQLLSTPRKYYGVKFETTLLAVQRSELAKYIKDQSPMRNAWTQALAQFQEQTGSIPALNPTGKLPQFAFYGKASIETGINCKAF